MIRKMKFLNIKKLNLENDQITNILKNIIQNLNFFSQAQLENYLKTFDVSINDLKKIEIENEEKFNICKVF